MPMSDIEIQEKMILCQRKSLVLLERFQAMG